MNELLESVMEAHDKFGRWPGFKKLHATIVTDGALWGMKGLLQDQEPREATVWLDQQHCTLSPFGDADWHCDFTPARVVIFKSDGTVVAERGNPRESLPATTSRLLGTLFTSRISTVTPFGPI
jgi:hypothetical protein